MTTINTDTRNGNGGMLSSLRYYENLRADASTQVMRPLQSNLDIMMTSTATALDAASDETTTLGICHLSALIGLYIQGRGRTAFGFRDVSMMALAAQHLNAGDGTFVPQAQDLNLKCPIRFTV